MNPKLMKAMNMRSSFSKREKIRRNPLRRRNSRSISLRRLYMARLYSQGATRGLLNLFEKRFGVCLSGDAFVTVSYGGAAFDALADHHLSYRCSYAAADELGRRLAQRADSLAVA